MSSSSSSSVNLFFSPSLLRRRHRRNATTFNTTVAVANKHYHGSSFSFSSSSPPVSRRLNLNVVAESRLPSRIEEEEEEMTPTSSLSSSPSPMMLSSSSSSSSREQTVSPFTPSIPSSSSSEEKKCDSPLSSSSSSSPSPSLVSFSSSASSSPVPFLDDHFISLSLTPSSSSSSTPTRPLRSGFVPRRRNPSSSSLFGGAHMKKNNRNSISSTPPVSLTGWSDASSSSSSSSVFGPVSPVFSSSSSSSTMKHTSSSSSVEHEMKRQQHNEYEETLSRSIVCRSSSASTPLTLKETRRWTHSNLRAERLQCGEIVLPPGYSALLPQGQLYRWRFERAFVGIQRAVTLADGTPQYYLRLMMINPRSLSMREEDEAKVLDQRAFEQLEVNPLYYASTLPSSSSSRKGEDDYDEDVAQEGTVVILYAVFHQCLTLSQWQVDTFSTGEVDDSDCEGMTAPRASPPPFFYYFFDDIGVSSTASIPSDFAYFVSDTSSASGAHVVRVTDCARNNQDSSSSIRRFITFDPSRSCLERYHFVRDFSGCVSGTMQNFKPASPFMCF